VRGTGTEGRAEYVPRGLRFSFRDRGNPEVTSRGCIGSLGRRRLRFLTNSSGTCGVIRKPSKIFPCRNLDPKHSPTRFTYYGGTTECAIQSRLLAGRKSRVQRFMKSREEPRRRADRGGVAGRQRGEEERESSCIRARGSEGAGCASPQSWPSLQQWGHTLNPKILVRTPHCLRNLSFGIPPFCFSYDARLTALSFRISSWPEWRRRTSSHGCTLQSISFYFQSISFTDTLKRIFRVWHTKYERIQ